MSVIDRLETFFINLSFIKKIILISFILIIFLTGLSLLIFSQSAKKTPQDGQSTVINEKEYKNITLSTEKGYLFKMKKSGQEGVTGFIKENPKIKGYNLFPSDFSTNSKVEEVKKDQDDPFLKNKNISLSNEHYFLTQKINGVPVFGSSVIVHVKNNNEIYAVSSKLITTNKTTARKFSNQEAQNIAFNKASEEYQGTLKYGAIAESIYNPALTGISEDSTNYYTLSVEIFSDTSDFSKIYFVDLESGKIVYDQEQVFQGLDRQVGNCNGTSNPPCPIARVEGSAPVSDPDTNSSYDILGEIYNFYFTNFNRDSLDNRGQTLKTFVNIHSVNNKPCTTSPNAYFTTSSTFQGMAYCKGLVVRDITAHEFTHAITSKTANLQYQYQSGALNESMSDIFASEVDGNWTMGEGSTLGVVRDMSNPTRFRQPDKLFSQNYLCGTADRGGVHRNNGVMNKTYYLMVQGGDFNGCSISGIGRSKASAIMYYTLTRYLTSTSNFKDMFTSSMQSCSDLYQNSAGECDQIKKAFQATEMDQQQAGSQQGGMCTSGVTAKVPGCANGSSGQTPPSTQIPPSSGSSGSAIPANDKLPIVKGTVYVDLNSNTSPDQGEGYQGATITISGPYNATASSDAMGIFSFEKIPTGTYTISATVGTAIFEPSKPFTISQMSVITADFGVPQGAVGSQGSGGGTGTGTSGSNNPFDQRLVPTQKIYRTGTCIFDTICKYLNQKSVQICNLKCTAN